MKTVLPKNFIFLFAFLIGLPGVSFAWWGAGHMVVSTIAYQRLEPGVKTQVDELIGVLQEHYPYTNHFIASATWPDDLKAEGIHYYDSWHYAHNHYNPDGVVLPDAPQVDVVWAINQSVSILRGKRCRNLEQARALAFLVHFVGDIHQPLHAGSMYSNACPGGDRGGNRFSIQESHGNLHKLWDDGCGLTTHLNDIDPYGVPKEALSPEELKRLEQFADETTMAQPANQFLDLYILDPRQWASESSKLAQQYAYHGVNEEVEGRKHYLAPGGQPSEEYITTAKGIVQQQLAKAGYRLANLLNQVLGA